MKYYYAIQNIKTKKYFRCRHTVTNKDYFTKDVNAAFLFYNYIAEARKHLLPGERIVKLKEVTRLEIVR